MNPNIAGIRHQGACFIRNGASIKYADIGVQLQNPAKPGSNGGFLVAESATFRNCRRSMVFLRDYQNFNVFTNKPIGNRTSFNNCTFTLDNTFDGDFAYFWDMVRFRNVTGIDFHHCQFINDAPHASSYPNDPKSGIQSINAEFSVDGNTSFFSGFGHAISAETEGGMQSFKVIGATFENNHVGIYSSVVKNPYIVKNTFRVGASFSSAWYNIGVYLVRSTGYKVEENNFDKYNQGVIDPVGILTTNSGTVPNQIYKNTFNGLHCANLANGTNRGGGTIGLQFLCNGNSNNQFDFAAKDGIGVAQRQGTPQISAGNTFTMLPPNSETHFQNLGGNLNYYWKGQNPINSSMPPKVNRIEAITANSCPSLIPPDESGNLSETEKQEMKTLFNTGAELSDRIYAADMLVREYLMDTSGQNFDSVRVWLKNKDDMESRFSIVETWLQQSQPDSAELALIAIPNQSSFSTEEEIEYGYFNTLKRLQINALRTGTSVEIMVQNNQDTLRQMAEAGDYYASFQAQVLLNEVLDSNYIREPVLPYPGGQGLIIPPGDRPVKQQTPYFLEAIPNPAQNTTDFHYRLQEDSKDAKLMLTSIDGRTVWETALEPASGKVKFDLTKIVRGIYLYQLVMDGKTLITNKLVVSK